MSKEQRVWMAAAVAGTVAPWFFFGRFFATEGLNLPLFVDQLFATRPCLRVRYRCARLDRRFLGLVLHGFATPRCQAL